MIIEKEGKFLVRVYDRGFVLLCDLVNGKWKTCEFNTREEAQEALNNYNEFWAAN